MVQPQDASNTFNVILGLDILVGLGLCFFGYLISQIRIAIGLILGAALAANIGFVISQNLWVALVAGIAGGLMGAVLSSVFYLMGVFLVAAFLGGLLGSLVSTAMSRHDPQVWIPLLLAVIFGSAAVLLKQLRIFITVVATAVGGAGWAVFAAIGFFVLKTGASIDWSSQAPLPEHEKILVYLALFLWILLAALGIAAQFKFLPPRKESFGENRIESGEA